MNTVTRNSIDIRSGYPEVPGPVENRGFSLLELTIGIFLSTLLMSGIVQLLSSSVSTYRLQLQQGQLEESARFARGVLISHISQAGYQPEPWQDLPVLAALTNESLDGDLLPGDQLGLQRWSMRNCYGNENPVKDGDGRPAFHLLQARFKINGSNNLALTCRYGPDASALQIQMNNFGLVENVESMQLLYAEDRDGDQIADSWVTGQTWQAEYKILSIKVALLLSTPQGFKQPTSEQISLLDKTITTPADGHLRRASILTSAIKGRLK